MQHIVHGCRLRLHSDDMTHHLLCQRKVYLPIGQRRVCQERCKNAFQVSNRLAYVHRNEIHDLVREHDAVTTHLTEQNILTQQIVRTSDLCRQTPFETGQQTLLDVLELHRRTITSQDQLLTALLQVVEDMEERILRTFQSCEILDIIDDEHIHRLIEIEEIRDPVLLTRVLELQLKSVRRYIQHACLRVERKRLMTDRASQVGLTYSAASVDKERVESRITGLLSNSQTCRTSQLVRLTGDERIEGIEFVQFGQIVVGHSRRMTHPILIKGTCGCARGRKTRTCA